MVLLIGLAAAVVVGLLLWYFLGQTKRPTGRELMEFNEAERKVKTSDPIFRGDIELLEKWGSNLLEDAIALRRAQLQRGDHPESRQR